MRSRRRRRAEAGLLLAVLGAVAVTVLLPAAVNAGFVADDWALAESVERLGYATTAREAVENLGSKPLLGLLLPLPFAVLGTDHGAAHAALALTLGVATSATLHVLLRRLGLGPWAAGAAALLALVFPWNDSARFWLTASMNQVAVLAYLLGALLALRAFDTTGRRALALHTVSVVSYVAAILTYEVVSAVVLATGAVYLTRASRRDALRRWAVDAAAGGVAIAWSLAATVKDTRPLADQIDNSRVMAVDGTKLAAHAVIPLEGAGEIAAVVAAAVVLTALVRIRRQPGAPGSRALRTWLRVGVGAVAATVLSWAPYVPAAYWTPLKAGLENRVNVLAALPLTVAVVALAHIAGLVLTGGHLRRSRAITFAVLSAIGAGYAARIVDSGDAWQRAGEAREAALAQIERAITEEEQIDRIYLVGAPPLTAQGVPVFVFSYDLFGAVRLRLGDFSVAAHPALAGARLRCDPGGVVALALPSPTYENDLIAAAGATSPYGTTWVVDARQGTGVRLDDQRTCAAYTRSIGLG